MKTESTENNLRDELMKWRALAAEFQDGRFAEVGGRKRENGSGGRGRGHVLC